MLFNWKTEEAKPRTVKFANEKFVFWTNYVTRPCSSVYHINNNVTNACKLSADADEPQSYGAVARRLFFTKRPVRGTEKREGNREGENIAGFCSFLVDVLEQAGSQRLDSAKSSSSSTASSRPQGRQHEGNCSPAGWPVRKPSWGKGTWSLLDLALFGERHRLDCVGLEIFIRWGNLSVTCLRPELLLILSFV